MEPDRDPDTDDLPLRANTNHILVRHYVLDLSVHFDRKVISGSVVLFLEPCSGMRNKANPQDDIGLPADEGTGTIKVQTVSEVADSIEDGIKGLGPTANVEKMFDGRERDRGESQTENIQSSHLWETTSDDDFTLVLDCCDLDVSEVEEVDVTSVSTTSCSLPLERPEGGLMNPQAAFLQNLISMPSDRWRQRNQLFLLCSRAPGAQGGSSLHFQRDRWSLQVRKKGISSPQEFPRALRICYETRPTGGSVRWTKDQDGRFVSRYTSFKPSVQQ